MKWIYGAKLCHVVREKEKKTEDERLEPCDFFHPWKWKKIIFQTIMFRFYVLGVYLFLWFTQILPNLVERKSKIQPGVTDQQKWDSEDCEKKHGSFGFSRSCHFSFYVVFQKWPAKWKTYKCSLYALVLKKNLSISGVFPGSHCVNDAYTWLYMDKVFRPFNELQILPLPSHTKTVYLTQGAFFKILRNG